MEMEGRVVTERTVDTGVVMERAVETGVETEGAVETGVDMDTVMATGPDDTPATTMSLQEILSCFVDE